MKVLHGINLSGKLTDRVFGSSYRWQYQEGDLVELIQVCGFLPSGNYRVMGVVGELLILGDHQYRTAIGLMYAPYIAPQPDISAPLVSTEEQMRFAEEVIQAIESGGNGKKRRRGKR